MNLNYNIMKYTAFCGLNNGDCAACLKKIQLAYFLTKNV